MFLITNDADLMKTQTKCQAGCPGGRRGTEARPSPRGPAAGADVTQGRERGGTHLDEVKVRRGG